MKYAFSLFLLTAIVLFSSPLETTAQRNRGQGGGFGQGDGPRIAPEDLKFEDGVASISDKEMFERLSYQGADVMRDAYLAGLQFVKFQVEDVDTEKPVVYFMNTKTRRAHPHFMRDLNFPRGRNFQMRGAICFRPLVNGPNGEPGVYTFDFQPNDSHSFEQIKICYDNLIAKAPMLEGKLVYHPLQGGVSRYEREKDQYEDASLPVYLDEDLFKDIGYLPLNASETFGRLRLMEQNEIPTARDVVLYRSLPNELPRVAGIITDVPQTPLSHVNLRAVQDKVPNAFITGASENNTIKPLIGKLVFYKVTPKGFDIREATSDELEKHFAAMRPAEPQTLVRDFSIQSPKPLSEIQFEQSASFGVKAANIAAMGRFNLPAGTIPDGYGIPFHFYDSFMRHNGFYDYAKTMMSDAEFQENQNERSDQLKEMRSMINDGEMPSELMEALTKLQSAFDDGTPIRCRSSTNNEDLPGFSGAGLYDSVTHRPDEGHLEKSIKQVFASMWNLRAYEEREFYRIDHLSAAMGVLLHPNYDDELANGVAVTQDILYQTSNNSYVNIQVGEDLVTNPEDQSVPEEILLGWSERDGYRLMRQSNRIADEERILKESHVGELREFLNEIHSKFSRLYGVEEDDPEFAMELEFKITRDNKLVVKQARPWAR